MRIWEREMSNSFSDSNNNCEDALDQSGLRPYLVLGLDLGIASLGWCLLDIRNQRVVDMGVHLWESVQEPKTKASLAATRRTARSQRRNTKRHRDRMRHCLALLKEHGLLPADATSASLQKVKDDPLTPLQARVAALDELVTDRQLAQALYNICNRRGYIPHGEGDGDAEGKKVLGAISENSEAMEKHGYRTAGEMMLREGEACGKPQGRSRNHGGDYSRCVTMAQLLAEADAILEAQRTLGNPKATESLQSAFEACVSWEKSTTERDERAYGQVGECVYLAPEKRAARACPSSERCAAFERISHVRIVAPDGSESILPAEVRRQAMAVLFSPVSIRGNKDCRVRYKDLRKLLRLPDSAYFKGVQDEKEEVAEPKCWRKLRATLPSDLMIRIAGDRDLADAVGSALAYASSEGSLRQRLAQLAPGELSDAETDAVCGLPYSNQLFSGYGSRGITALQMLCDAFEDYGHVTTLAEAEAACGLMAKRMEPPKHKGACLPPYTDFDSSCSNPVVLRAMGRVRKLVNAVIREYAMPDEVHVELARELKLPKRVRAEIDKANRERAKARDQIRGGLAEDMGCPASEVSGKLVEKIEYWREQGGRDVYTDEPISYERLLAEGDTYCQVDHILPRSRSCDDSRANKVLALSKSNQDKRGKTPFEWLDGTPQWDGFKARVSDMRRRGYPNGKVKRLLETDFAAKQGKFIERNLNDTRYASRRAVSYIAAYLEFPADNPDPNGNLRDKHVCAVAGGATSALRYAWGFAKKDREKDDLHHAVDAAIIAACRENAVVKVAKYSEQRHHMPEEQRKRLLAGTQPWEGFARQVEQTAAAVIPTRKVEHGATGRLFEDTIYRFEGLSLAGDKGVLVADGKAKPVGNYKICEDGSAVIPDGMAFLRLWWDADAGSKGKYLKESVYYADLASVRNGTYVPRSFASTCPRCDWPIVPQSVLRSGPSAVLHRGDLVSVNGELLRYLRFNIANGTVKFSKLQKFPEETSPKTGLGRALSSDSVHIVPEDILGCCFSDCVIGGFE